MLQQTERLEQLELLEREIGIFDLKALRNSVISAFDKEIQNKTNQKEKNRSLSTSVLAGAGGFHTSLRSVASLSCGQRPHFAEQKRQTLHPRPTVLEWLCESETSRFSSLFAPFHAPFRQFNAVDFFI